MPRYFFDLCDGNGFLADPEGMDLHDVKAMRAEALSLVRSLIAGDVSDGAAINLSHYIAVRNQAGDELYRLNFGDVLKVEGGPPFGVTS